MIKRKLINIVNSISIGAKIFLGFFVIFLMFISQYIYIFKSFEKVDERFSSQRELSENTISVMVISKDVAEIQRLAQSYGISGSETIYLKLQSNYDEILTELIKVKGHTTDKKSLTLLYNMEEVIKRYGDNIKSLRERYRVRDKVIQKELPRVIKEGLHELEVLGKKQSLSSYREAWLQINLDAVHFLNKREHHMKKSVNSKLNELENDRSLMSIDQRNGGQFKKRVREFREVFDQAVQLNRVYLSLVNVVMAGEAVEFTNLSELLRIHFLSELNTMSKKSAQKIEESKSVVEVIIIFSLPILFIITFFYVANISKGITRIAQTFNNLISGDFSNEIPGLHRKDEIGVLAKAANRFKELNFEYRKSKLKAEGLARTKSEFLANMSHEIRTPMNGILGMVSLLRETNVDSEQKDMLDTISSCGDNLSTILNDILDLSKAEFGKMNLESAPFDMEKALSEINLLFEKQAEEKNIEFFCGYVGPFRPKMVRGDVTRLKQVLINLLSNAMKFTHEGKVSLEVKVKYILGRNFEFEFVVKDTGIGMEESELKRIFNAFDQADASTTREYGGTGLGLAISQNIVNLMGAELEVKSQKNLGSTFHFSAHFYLEDEEKLKKEVSFSEERTSIGDLRALLVEDNPINIKVAVSRLKKFGLEVDIAENGREAIEACEKSSYDIIFMDMQMPVMDGITASRVLKREEKTRHIPIVAMTANVLEEDRKKCLDAGMEYFIPKPIKKEAIKNVLEEIFPSAA